MRQGRSGTPQCAMHSLPDVITSLVFFILHIFPAAVMRRVFYLLIFVNYAIKIRKNFIVSRDSAIFAV